MKLLKLLFAVIGVFVTIAISGFSGYLIGLMSKTGIPDSTPYFSIDKILTYQMIAEKIDANNVDSARFIVTDTQDKEILTLCNLADTDKRYETQAKITLSKVAEYRRSHATLYYPNGKELIPANSNVEEYLAKSLLK